MSKTTRISTQCNSLGRLRISPKLIQMWILPCGSDRARLLEHLLSYHQPQVLNPSIPVEGEALRSSNPLHSNHSLACPPTNGGVYRRLLQETLNLLRPYPRVLTFQRR